MEDFSVVIPGKGKIILDDDGFEPNKLPKDLCKMLCDEVDNGPRYSYYSRYNYSVNSYGDMRGISFGTPQAAIASFLVHKLNRRWTEKFKIIVN